VAHKGQKERSECVLNMKSFRIAELSAHHSLMAMPHPAEYVSIIASAGVAVDIEWYWVGGISREGRNHLQGVTSTCVFLPWRHSNSEELSWLNKEIQQVERALNVAISDCCCKGKLAGSQNSALLYSTSGTSSLMEL